MHDDPVPFREMVESSISPFVVVDGQGFVVWAGPTVELLLGRPAASYVGVHFLDVIHPSAHEAAIAAFADFVDTDGFGEPWIGPPMIMDVVGADGPVTCEVSASAGSAIGRDGAVLQVRRWRGTVLLHQIVDAIVGDESLAEALGRVVDLVEHDLPPSDAAVGVGWDGTRFERVVTRANRVAAQLVADSPGETPWARAIAEDRPIGGATLDHLPGDVAAAAEAAGFVTCWAFPVRVRLDHAPSAALVVWRRSAVGIAGHLTATAGRIAGLVSLALEAERTRHRWQRAARTDELTGLSNRADLDERMDELATTAPEEPIAALFCDLDDFKPVNDHLGHRAGDHVLVDVAARLRRVIRPSDMVVRWGGDEFVVLCEGATSTDDAVAIARRVIDEVNKPLVVDGEVVRLGVSVGVAVGPAARSSQLVRRADDALRQAKAGGKNVWRLAEERGGPEQ